MASRAVSCFTLYVRIPCPLSLVLTLMPAGRHPERGLDPGASHPQHDRRLLRRAQRRHPHLAGHGRARVRHVQRHEHRRDHHLLHPLWFLLGRM